LTFCCKINRPKTLLGGVGIEIDPLRTVSGTAVRYTIRHGGEEIKLSISIISSDSSYGPPFNIDLTYHVWSLSEFFGINYAIVVLPSPTSGDKIVYVMHYWTA